MADLQAAFERYWCGRCITEFDDLGDMIVRWATSGDELSVMVSDVLIDAPQAVLCELAERVCLRINGNALVDVFGRRTSEWVSENLSTVRSRLRATMGAKTLYCLDGWEVWCCDVKNLEVREGTKLVLIPRSFEDAPGYVRSWVYDCAHEHRRVRPSCQVYDWMWDARMF